MKEFTLNQLHNLTNIPTPTIRAWTLKAENGVVYDGNNIKNVRIQLAKRFKEAEIQKMFGCKVEEIVIIKSVKTSKNYIDIADLQIGKTYILHNYSLETTLTLIKMLKVEEEELYLFKNEKGYKALSKAEIEKPNIKFEEC